MNVLQIKPTRQKKDKKSEWISNESYFLTEIVFFTDILDLSNNLHIVTGNQRRELRTMVEDIKEIGVLRDTAREPQPPTTNQQGTKWASSRKS